MQQTPPFVRTHAHTHSHTCRLKYVNLDNNELYTVPQLRLVGTSPLKSSADCRGTPVPHARQSFTPRPYTCRTTPRKSQTPSAGREGNELRESNKEMNLEAEKRSALPPERKQVQLVESRDIEERERDCERRRDSEEKRREADGDKMTGEVAEKAERSRLPELREMPASVSSLPPSMAPFPHLHTLSLANNLVSENLHV